MESSNILSSSIIMIRKSLINFKIFDTSTAIVPTYVVLEISHASLALSHAQICLDSVEFTPLKIA